MVFCNTRRNVDRLTRGLHQQKIYALAIHGGLSQTQRSNTLQAFHEGETLILICTDIAARGLDIKNVSHIYNFDIPSTSTEYIHRIGRTARADKKGIAISFVCQGDRGEFKQIFRENPNLEKLNTPKLESIIQINFKSNDDRRESNKNRGRGHRQRTPRRENRESSRREPRRRFSRGNSSRSFPRRKRFNRR